MIAHKIVILNPDPSKDGRRAYYVHRWGAVSSSLDCRVSSQQAVIWRSGAIFSYRTPQLPTVSSWRRCAGSRRERYCEGPQKLCAVISPCTLNLETPRLHRYTWALYTAWPAQTIYRMSRLVGSSFRHACSLRGVRWLDTFSSWRTNAEAFGCWCS